VDTVSLEMETGKTTIVIGLNGAGKSTLLRLLSDELRPSSGQIFCDAKNLDRTLLWLLACKRAVMT
jgi:iron complex transport system ATP-binding protein